jgi:hypothetical protein
MAKKKEDPSVPHKILGGVLFTLILLIIVPALCGHFLSVYVEDAIGDTEFMFIPSDVLVNLVMWIIIIGFTFALGGGRILKKYGVFGILGLLAAYYLLGDLEGGIFAVIMLVVISVIIYLVKRKLRP